MDFQLMSESWPQLLGALPRTLALAGASLSVGLVIGVGVAAARLSGRPWPARLAYGYVYLFRSTPLLVQLFLIYYGSGQFRSYLEPLGLWTFFREPWFCAILALALNTGAYTAEVFRGGILSVGAGLVDAARALGMSRLVLFRTVVLPLAFRQALPAYGNEVILMIKATSLASTITIMEITGTARKIIAETWSPVEVFIVAGAIYLTVNFIVTRLVRALETRLTPGET